MKPNNEPETNQPARRRKHWASMAVSLFAAMISAAGEQYIMAIGMLCICIFIIATDNE